MAACLPAAQPTTSDITVMIRIYADFNSKDEQGRVVLKSVASLRDLEVHKDEIHVGMKVTLYMPDVEVDGVLVFDRVWLGIPDYSATRDL